MEILIYGAGEKGKLALTTIKCDYEGNYSIVGFIDKSKHGECLGYPIFKLEEVEDFNGVILIALLDFQEAQAVWKVLKKRGYTDIFWFQDKKTVLKYEDFFVEQCRNCMDWGDSILPQVEMHIIDSCNLNCRGCSHFSPIFSDTLPDLKARISDVKKLKEKITTVLKFYILGGEPFLNPEINDYICNIRSVFPYTQLYIVTNGLLIENLPKEVLQCVKDNQVCISISEYKPTRKKIGKIRLILDEFQILYEIRGFSQKEKFYLPLTINEQSKYPKTCISNKCVTIWNGKIARCPQLMYISHFNTYFNTNLPEDGVMDLDNCAEGQKLLHNLQKEVPLCNYCIENEIEWSTCGKTAKLEDFAVMD